MKTLLLVRHGTTDWVDNNILHGITDIPLNANGLRQAHEVAEALKNVPASHLYSSSLTRCMQTAQAISANIHLDPIPMDGLVEMNFGWLEGKPLIDHQNSGKEPSGAFHRPVQVYFCAHDQRRVSPAPAPQSAFLRGSRSWMKIKTRSPSWSRILRFSITSSFTTLVKISPRDRTIIPCAPAAFARSRSMIAGQARLVRLDDAAHLSEYQKNDKIL